MFGSSDFKPVTPPISVFPGYVRKETTVLAMSENMMSMSGDDFSVKDQNGSTVLKIGGKVVSVRDRKVFKGPDGAVLFELADKKIAIKRTFVGEGPDGKDLFKVSKNITLAVKIENESRELELKSDVMWKDARVELDGSTVVDINRDISGREVAGKQSYTVKVAAGIDLALATALAICFDELAEDKEDEKDE